MTTVESLLAANEYPGRGIIAGMSADGKYAVNAYFIMGRSSNSRNRVFAADGDDIRTKAYDESKLEDPSLIIYYPVRAMGSSLIVTNGDQTDTVFDALSAGESFESALEKRTFEPDAPNFTPRISSVSQINDGFLTYKLSILKCSDRETESCCRYTFAYSGVPGKGHFIHTYRSNGDPLPSFDGEPEEIAVPDGIDYFTAAIWNSLNEENKISLFVRYTDIETGDIQTRIVNKNQENEAQA